MTRNCILFFFLLINLNSSAQDWVSDKKDLIIHLSQDFQNYEKVFDNDGNRRPSPSIKHYVTNAGAEYGLHKNFSLGLNVPLVHNSISKDTTIGIVNAEAVNKPGDVVIFARFNYQVNEELTASAFLHQALATSEDEAVLGLNTGFADFAEYIGGSARWKASDRFYATFDIGYRLRHNGFGDEIQATAELGFRMTGNLWIVGKSNGVQPLENGDEDVHGGNFGLYEQHMGFWDTGAALRYNAKKWDFTAMVSGNFKGQFSPAAGYLQLGIRYKLLNRETEEE